MKERPILFSGEMVRAILEGRKTQTRRVMKLQPGRVTPAGRPLFYEHADKGRRISPKCPYGAPGDRLWVRETWRCNGSATDVATIFYRASARKSYTEMCEQFPVTDKKRVPVDGKWRPSIHMPRWAARILLEVTDVRVERLQDISREDALQEGIDRWDETASVNPYRNYRKGEKGEMDIHCSCSERSFMTLWESINGAGSWNANPWVWVVEFKRIEADKQAAA